MSIMKAVMYGAGNIGRGFIGALMNQASYQVSFVDVDQSLVRQLNEKGQYTLRIIRSEGYEDTLIKGIRAVDGLDKEAVIDAIAECDLMATAVGARILPLIAPLIAQGLQRRFERKAGPLNIIICENLMDANHVLENLLKKGLTAREIARFDKEVGLVEASIGRMVPIQTEVMRAGDPLRVCTEAYAFLPVDKDAFKGPVPAIKGLVPYSPFEFYLRRKLYLHNMGHACCAYLGLYAGKTYLYEAVADQTIELMTRAAMAESAAALSQTYQAPVKDLMAHADDLVYRFQNKALGDSCTRVGADIPRKLSREDRLIGAARFCLDAGIQPVFITLGAAAALYQYHIEQGFAQTEAAASRTMIELSGLRAEDSLAGLILGFYRLFAQGTSLNELYKTTLEEKHRLAGPVL